VVVMKSETVGCADVGHGLFEVDVDPPYAWHYEDLNIVRWFAQWVFEDRVRYLEWIVARRRAELEAWRAEHTDWLSRFKSTDVHERLRCVQRQLETELADREPLNAIRTDSWVGGKRHTELVERPWRSRKHFYRAHLDSPRWKLRIRIRKMVSVGWRCEYPGCTAQATDCHHFHYDTLGFEENCDLEASCHHYEVRHGTRF
jgi:hypothetical protein